MKTSILVRTSFEGIHCYPSAPEEVSFLRTAHRHLFLVSVQLEVFHDDRDLEFFIVQHNLNKFLGSWPVDLGEQSCEQMAKDIITFLRKEYGDREVTCIVSEDGENAAVVQYS